MLEFHLTRALLCRASNYKIRNSKYDFFAYLINCDACLVVMWMGALAALTLPPFNMLPLLFISFSVLYVILANVQSSKKAFLLGWCFGLGYFSLGLYWFANALLLNIKLYGWLIPFAIFGSAAVFAIYFGVATLLIHQLKLRGLIKLLNFAMILTVAHWCLGHSFILIAFPWNLFAYSWSFSLRMMQCIAIFGVYGLSFITVFCAAAFGAYYCDRSKASVYLAIIMLGAMGIFGSLRLAEAEYGENTDVFLRVVQANVPVSVSDASFAHDKNVVEEHVKLTRSPGLEHITHVLWPESAVPFLISDENQDLLSVFKPKGNYFLITGGTRLSDKKVYNSLFITDKNGLIIEHYDKHYLVPFGETIPFFDFFAKIVPRIRAVAGNFAVGEIPNKSLKLDDTPVLSPLICYEVIFPGAVAKRDDKVEWLVNITNDGWFGLSSEPYQHFAMSRARSIEEGLPLIRVANTGISAIIDGYGRIIRSLPLNTSGVIDAHLPKAIAGSTIYAKYVSNWSNIVLLILFMGFIIFSVSFRRS